MYNFVHSEMSNFGNVCQSGYLQFIKWDLDKSRDPNLNSPSQIWNFCRFDFDKKMKVGLFRNVKFWQIRQPEINPN